MARTLDDRPPVQQYPRWVPLTPSAASLRTVRNSILAWYEADHRELPFRRSREPWPVLVAEIMLQQTQATRIAERFDAFLDRYPTPAAVAAATPAQVLADWSGLGYNRRALNLHAAATEIVHNGWPSSVAGLEQLPGIGPYSARAVAAIAFGQPVGAVDTNVRRWLVRRLSANPEDAGELQGLADRLARLARSADQLEPGTWTHATMEFGARICVARAPRCDICPVRRGCPSRSDPRRVPVPRQSAATASNRAARGALLRGLVSAPAHRLNVSRAKALVDGGMPGDGYDALVDGLEREGLLHRDRRYLALGPRD
jgi:A/G-specific adenine glycosylase